jgi:hypothetical protein
MVGSIALTPKLPQTYALLKSVGKTLIQNATLTKKEE